MKKIRSKDEILLEMGKIMVVTVAGGKRLMNPVTKTQRIMMEAFGIEEERLKTYVYNK
jgi:hypothetical protein